jgi:hypothetical protein
MDQIVGQALATFRRIDKARMASRPNPAAEPGEELVAAE